ALGKVHHHVAQPTGGLADVDHADHVRVPQPPGELGLAIEPLRDLAVGEQPRVQDLHGERPADLHVARAIDRAHRALAEPRLDQIPIGEDLADQLVGIVFVLGDFDRHQNLPNTVTVPPQPSVLGATPMRPSPPDLTHTTVL